MISYSKNNKSESYNNYLQIAESWISQHPILKEVNTKIK